MSLVDRLRVGWLNEVFGGRGTARVEDAHGTPTQSHVSPNILVYEDQIGSKTLEFDVLGLNRSALEATQGQMDGFFSQLPYKCHLEEVASVGD